MRKHFYFALVAVLAAMLVFASCEKKTQSNNTDLPTTTNGVQKRLTGDEQIEKLNGIGQQILSNFKTQEQEDLVRLTDYLLACMEGANWQAVLDSAGSGHVSYAGMQPMMATLRRMAGNAAYAPMNFMDALTPDNWFVSDFFGEYEFVDSSKKWRFIATNDNAAIFNCTDSQGKKVVITVKASGDTYTLMDTVTVYNEKTGRETKQIVAGHVPSRIEVTLTDNAVELVNIALTFDINRKDHFKVAGNVRLANIVQTYDMNITRSAAKGNYEMKVNGKSVCKLALDNSGLNILAIDPNNNLSTRGDFVKFDSKLENELKPGKTAILISLLGGEMSIQGTIDGDSYYAQMKKLQANDNLTGKEWANANAEVWNENIYMFVYYGSDIRQAQIMMEVDVREGEDYQSYGIVPVIYFIEDKMSMQFDQYFTRNSFGTLIDATEELINKYITFFKELQIAPVDL